MKQKDILIIIILLFVFVIAWIGSSIYSSLVSSTISTEVNKDIDPIAPNFDTKTVDKLKAREKISPAFDLTPITPTPISLPTIAPSKNASAGGKLLL